MQIIVSPLKYSPDEYNIAAMLSTESLEKVALLQARLKNALGDAIWLVPKTVYTLP